jgi:membrane protein implicated in regulation of membrane protease activity
MFFLYFSINLNIDLTHRFKNSYECSGCLIQISDSIANIGWNLKKFSTKNSQFMNMIDRDWTKKIILKYILFQIPSFLILIVILLLLDHWYNFGYFIIAGVLILWILKDSIMFPIVWKSYETRAHKVSWQSKIINKEALVVEQINPEGYVRFNGELWKARCINDKIDKDEKVVIKSIEDKTLVVTKSVRI